MPPTIPALLALWARRTPASAALLSPGGPVLDFSRLFELAQATARRLRELGVARADRVAIVLPNGPEMAVSFLGASAAAVAAPLNPAYRPTEFEYYFDDLHPRALVALRGATSPARALALTRGIPVLEVPPLAEQLASLAGRGGSTGSTSDDGAPASPADVALVLHTSGTTARPKMVPLTHGSLCESARNIARAFALDPADRSLNIMPLFHIHGLVGSLLASLSAGSSVVCTQGLLVTRFARWLGECRPTWYTAVPTMHRAILERVSSNEGGVRSHSLRFIRSSSSALPPDLMAALEATFNVPVVEAYGMTEAAHQIAANPLPPGERKPGSVGLPSGPDVGIVDETDAFLGRGRTGEIVLRGSTVITSYLASPDVNERAFLRGWFRTGDSGYVDADGYLFIAGRIKEIINRGGEKIAPREVEAVLLAHPAVADAVVFAVADARLGEDVGAAIVPRAGATADEGLIKRFVASRLAAFKVPRVIRIVGELPLGPTGKVQRIGMADRLGVTTPAPASAAPGTAGSAPRTALEHQLAAIWRDVLGTSDAGIEEDFFLAGGDSILATTFVVHATESLGAHVSLVDFMEAPTIAGLAAAIERRGRLGSSDGPARIVAIQPEGAGLPLFCTPPLDGSLVGYGRLSSHLGRDQPMWGFAQLPMRPGQPPHRVDDIAAANIEALRAMWPEGPYLLLGDCFGGLVAYEMARRLRQSGEEVALLAMVDTPLRWQRDRRSPRRLKTRVTHGLSRARFHLSALARIGAREQAAYVWSRCRSLVEASTFRLGLLVHEGCVRHGLQPPAFAASARYANAWAERRYEAGAYGGRTAFFRTSAPTAGFPPSPLLGWEGLLEGDTRIIELPGEHALRFLPVTLEALAQRLKKEVASASMGSRYPASRDAGPPRATPRVTIGLPVLDGEPYLSEAIDSILAQSFTDFELVISDNASTDRTEEICRAYASRDPRVRYMRSPVNIGGALNFNRVLDEARGLYFKWAAHDDVLAPTWLARAVSTLDDQPSAVLCQSLITVIDQDGAVVGPEERLLTRVTGGRAAARFGNLVLADHRCNDLFGLIRTGILRRTGGIGRYIAADRVLLAELGLHGRFETIPEPLFFVRDHPARSVNARPFHERTSWYDTTAPDRTVFPHWRFYREYFRLPGRARVAPLQRLRCYGHLCRWPWANMNWARLVSDVLIAARPGLNRRLTQMGRRLVRPG